MNGADVDAVDIVITILLIELNKLKKKLDWSDATLACNRKR
jgi:hypothetical protein